MVVFRLVFDGELRQDCFHPYLYTCCCLPLSRWDQRSAEDLFVVNAMIEQGDTVVRIYLVGIVEDYSDQLGGLNCSFVAG